MGIRKVLKNDGKKKLKYGSYSMVLTCAVIAVTIVLNLIVAEIPSQYTQIDVSTEKLYTVSDDTEEFLKSLKEDVIIYFIAQNGQEDETVQKLLDRYEDLSSHIKVEQKDPVIYPKFTAQYTDQELADNSLIVVCEDRSKVIDSNQLYLTEVDYQTYSYNITGFDGEGQITSAISYVTSEELPILYTLSGHEEAEIAASVTEAIKKQNIEIRELNLIREESVPKDADCLLIGAPASDISQEEAKKLIDYLEQGGSALIFTDYYDEKMVNLQSVLENYGVRTADSVILEGSSDHYVMQTPYYLLPDIQESDVTADTMESGKYILMPAAQPIENLEQYRDTISQTPILTTSNSAYAKTNIAKMESYEKTEEDVDGPFTVGMYIKEEVDDENETKIIYYSSASLLNESVDQMVSGGNLELINESVSVLTGSEESASISIPSKYLQTERLTLTSYDISFWMIVTIILLPGICIVLGFAIWLKRRKQ